MLEEGTGNQELYLIPPMSISNDHALGGSAVIKNFLSGCQLQSNAYSQNLHHFNLLQFTQDLMKLSSPVVVLMHNHT